MAQSKVIFLAFCWADSSSKSSAPVADRWTKGDAVTSLICSRPAASHTFFSDMRKTRNTVSLNSYWIFYPESSLSKSLDLQILSLSTFSKIPFLAGGK